MTFTAHPEHLPACNKFVVALPTPIDQYNKPYYTQRIKAPDSTGMALISVRAVFAPSSRKSTYYVTSSPSLQLKNPI